MAKTNIQTVAGRKKLPSRTAPYFHRLEKGGYIGYRKLSDGTGTWIARWRNESGKQIYRALGSIKTYDAACKAAQAWIEQAQGGVIEIVTVAEACRRYVENRRQEKGEGTAKDAEGRFRRTVYEDSVGKVKLPNLKTAHLIDWRNSQIMMTSGKNNPESERRAKDGANRNLSSLKAALNLAYRMSLVKSTAQWDRVEAFKGVSKQRDRFLSIDERKRLLLASSVDLQKLIKALLLTAARPGEIATCRIEDLDHSGFLTLRGKTGRRTVPISPDALKHLKDCAAERNSSELLLVRADGKQWTRFDWRDGIQEARTNARLGDEVVAYSLRHTAITELVVSGIDVLSVARVAGTSIEMIQRYYGHLMSEKVAKQLAKVAML